MATISKNKKNSKSVRVTEEHVGCEVTVGWSDSPDDVGILVTAPVDGYEAQVLIRNRHGEKHWRLHTLDCPSQINAIGKRIF